MKSEEKFSGLSSVSFFITAVYFILNAILIVEWLNMQGVLSVFAEVVFTLDCFTWHIYGIVSFLGLVFRFINLKNSSIRAKVYAGLHLMLMTASFFEIYFLMQNAF